MQQANWKRTWLACWPMWLFQPCSPRYTYAGLVCGTALAALLAQWRKVRNRV